MVKKDGAETRKNRINDLNKRLQAAITRNNGEPISLSKTVAYEMYNSGLTKEKVMEYLRVIEGIGHIELDYVNDKIRRPKTSV